MIWTSRPMPLLGLFLFGTFWVIEWPDAERPIWFLAVAGFVLVTAAVRAVRTSTPLRWTVEFPDVVLAAYGIAFSIPLMLSVPATGGPWLLVCLIVFLVLVLWRCMLPPASGVRHEVSGSESPAAALASAKGAISEASAALDRIRVEDLVADPDSAAAWIRGLEDGLSAASSRVAHLKDGMKGGAE